MSLNFLNFMHFQIVKNKYILPTFCLNPVFYWLIFGSDQLGPIFYWLVLARSGFFETAFWLGLARSGFFEQIFWLGLDRSRKKLDRPMPSSGLRMPPRSNTWTDLVTIAAADATCRAPVCMKSAGRSRE